MGEKEDLLTELVEDIPKLCEFLNLKNRAGKQLTPTPTQVKIVEAILWKENDLFAVKATTQWGKSEAISLGALLASTLRENEEIKSISATDEQARIIFDNTTRHIPSHQFLIDSLAAKNRYFDQKNLFTHLNQKKIDFTTGSQLAILSALAGHPPGEGLLGHGGTIIVVDESGSIPDEIYYSKIKRMTGSADRHRILVESGTPHTNNHFKTCFTNPRYKTLTVDYKLAIEEGRMTKDYVESRREELTQIEFDMWYGAIFSEETEDALFKGKDLKHMVREIPEIKTGNIRKILGADPARFGIDTTVLDKTTCYENSLYALNEIRKSDKKSTMETTGRIVKWDNEEHFDKIIVDDSGLGGGVTDRLNELEQRSKTIPFIGGASPEGEIAKKRYLNLRAQYYFKLANLAEKGNLIVDPKVAKEYPILIEQLSKLKVKYTSSGKAKIVYGDEEKGKTEKSPDFADAFMYSCSDIEAKDKLVFDFT